jgi:Cu/Ag efflux protein CusF
LIWGWLEISGDPSKNVVYVVEPATKVVRKLDLLTKKATIIAGVHFLVAAALPMGLMQQIKYSLLQEVSF